MTRKSKAGSCTSVTGSVNGSHDGVQGQRAGRGRLPQTGHVVGSGSQTKARRALVWDRAPRPTSQSRVIRPEGNERSGDLMPRCAILPSPARGHAQGSSCGCADHGLSKGLRPRRGGGGHNPAQLCSPSHDPRLSSICLERGAFPSSEGLPSSEGTHKGASGLPRPEPPIRRRLFLIRVETPYESPVALSTLNLEAGGENARKIRRFKESQLWGEKDTA